MLNRKQYVHAVVCLLSVFIMLTPVFSVKASEKEAVMGTSQQTEKETVMGTLQQTVKEVEIREEPDEDSDTLASLQKGTAVIVYGEPQDSWCQIEYRGIEGYIESGALEQYQAEENESLEEEFQSVEDETLRTVDEYELLQKEKRTSRIWGAVIAVLVIAIFVVGIISALRQNREKEEEEKV